MLNKKKLVILLAAVTFAALAYAAQRDSGAQSWNQPAVAGGSSEGEASALKGIQTRGDSSVSGLQESQTTPQQRALTVDRFHATKSCRGLLTAMMQMQSEIESCESQASQPDYYRSCKKSTLGFDQKIKTANGQIDAAGCSRDPQAVDRDYYGSVSQAAQSGDVDAQMCYVSGGFTLPPQDVDQYKSDAMHYIDMGFARGDWRVVQILTTPAESLVHGGSPMISLPIGNPYMVYRMNNLLLLGTNDDAYAAILKAGVYSSAVDLSDAQRKAGVQWAQQEYQRHFVNSPKLSVAPEPCTM